MNKDQQLEAKWLKLRNLYKDQLGKKPDINGVLFLIGIQEVGSVRSAYTKEEKQDLMHVAVCSILKDYFEYIGKDEDGWPHWEPVKKFPQLDLEEQEQFLKSHIILYFENNDIL